MYAVIKTGGKQYRVEKNAVIQVEKLAGEAGDEISFDQVLLIGEGEKAEIGMPLLAGARVTAEVLEQTRGPKIVVFKKKRRKHYRRKQGHRQDLTVLRVTDIKAEAKAEAKPKAEAKAAEAAPNATADKAGE